MTKLYILLLFLFFSFPSQGQYYKWVTGGGSNAAIQNKEETVTHMCTDDNGNVYVLSQVGDHQITADTFYLPSAFNVGITGFLSHILFTSYDCEGNMRFAKLIEARLSGRPGDIAYSNGRIYVSGIMDNSNKRIGYDTVLTNLYQESFLAKFDTTGQYEWHTFVGQEDITVNNKVAEGVLAIDGQGYIHKYVSMLSGVQLTPSVISQAGTYDLRYDVGGNLLSATRLDLADTGYYIIQADIDKQTGNQYALFRLIGGSTTRSLYCMVAFDPLGNQIWADTLSPLSGIGSFRYVPGDGIYFSGAGSGTLPFIIGGVTVSNTLFPTGGYCVVGKLDINDGSAKWIYHFDGNYGGQSFIDLEMLPNDRIALLGVFNGYSVYQSDTIQSPLGGTMHPIFAIIEKSGKLIKLDQLHATGGHNGGRVLTTDKNSNLYLGGWVSSSIRGDGLTPYVSTGATDFFVMKYGVDCDCSPADAPQPDFSYSHNPNDDKEVTFWYTGSTPLDSLVYDFGDGSKAIGQSQVHHYNAPGHYNVCVRAYARCGVKDICKTVNISVGITDLAGGALQIYPNPTTKTLQVSLGNGIAISKASIRDMQGRLVREYPHIGSGSLDVSDLPQGMYLLYLDTDKGRMQYRFLKETAD